MKWKDETSYSRGDLQQVPRTWVATVGEIDVIVTRKIHLSGWYLHSRALRIDMYGLNEDGLEAAKREALSVVRLCLVERVRKDQEVLNEL